MHEAAFRLLCLNHTLLSDVSTLGAHRERLINTAMLDLLNDAVRYDDSALHQEKQSGARLTPTSDNLAEHIRHAVPKPESKEQLVLQQIGLVFELSPELTALHTCVNKAV